VRGRVQILDPNKRIRVRNLVRQREERRRVAGVDRGVDRVDGRRHPIAVRVLHLRHDELLFRKQFLEWREHRRRRGGQPAGDARGPAVTEHTATIVVQLVDLLLGTVARDARDCREALMMGFHGICGFVAALPAQTSGAIVFMNVWR